MNPHWLIDPLFQYNFLSEFLLGDDVLVAPIVEKGATSKSVVFPPGLWKYPDTDAVYEGPAVKTLTNLNINSNLYFIRTQWNFYNARIVSNSDHVQINNYQMVTKLNWLHIYILFKILFKNFTIKVTCCN